jgi:cupin-like protein
VDAIQDWKASSDWTFEFFKSRYGTHRVLAYRYQGDKYRPDNVTQMQLADYIDGVMSNDWESFAYYIRDKWALLVEHPELAADYRSPKYFFDWFSILPSFLRLPYPRIFIGPKGAVTPLHKDIWGTHAWLSQLVGRKRWILFPPAQGDLLYDHQVQPDTRILLGFRDSARLVAWNARWRPAKQFLSRAAGTIGWFHWMRPSP